MAADVSVRWACPKKPLFDERYGALVGIRGCHHTVKGKGFYAKLLEAITAAGVALPVEPSSISEIYYVIKDDASSSPILSKSEMQRLIDYYSSKYGIKINPLGAPLSDIDISAENPTVGGIFKTTRDNHTIPYLMHLNGEILQVLILDSGSFRNTCTPYSFLNALNDTPHLKEKPLQCFYSTQFYQADASSCSLGSIIVAEKLLRAIKAATSAGVGSSDIREILSLTEDDRNEDFEAFYSHKRDCSFTAVKLPTICSMVSQLSKALPADLECPALSAEGKPPKSVAEVLRKHRKKLPVRILGISATVGEDFDQTRFRRGSADSWASADSRASDDEASPTRDFYPTEPVVVTPDHLFNNYLRDAYERRRKIITPD